MKLQIKKTNPAFFLFTVAYCFLLFGAPVILTLLVHGLPVLEVLLLLPLLVVIRALVVRVNGRLRRLERIAASAVPVV